MLLSLILAVSYTVTFNGHNCPNSDCSTEPCTNNEAHHMGHKFGPTVFWLNTVAAGGFDSQFTNWNGSYTVQTEPMGYEPSFYMFCEFPDACARHSPTWSAGELTLAFSSGGCGTVSATNNVPIFAGIEGFTDLCGYVGGLFMYIPHAYDNPICDANIDRVTLAVIEPDGPILWPDDPAHPGPVIDPPSSLPPVGGVIHLAWVGPPNQSWQIYSSSDPNSTFETNWVQDVVSDAVSGNAEAWVDCTNVLQQFWKISTCNTNWP